jgi:purine-binding chemotaxis protein CheW
MANIVNLLVFVVSGLRCALPLSEIERVVHAVQVNPVPRAPAIVMGLVNVQGRVIPVLNIRKLLRLTDIGISLSDQLIIAKAASLPVAMLVDEVSGVYQYSESDITVPDELYSDIEFLRGVAKLQNGVLYIYNLDGFLSSELAAEIVPLLAVDTLSPADPTR